MFNFDVKIDSKSLKFELEEDKMGIELKSKIIELADISLDAKNLKVFAAGHYVKDDILLKEQINRDKLKLVLAKYEKKDLKPVSSPPKKQPKIEEIKTNNTNNNNLISINNNNNTNNNNLNPQITTNNPIDPNSMLDDSFGNENLSEEVLNYRKREWEARKTVEKLVEISHKIASRQGNTFDNETFAVLTDSEGKEFPLSEKDRIGITCGQMLYNFGKKKLFNDKNYEEALKIFEAAEREFLNVSEEILELIDNYGLLCLDISWAYYQMQKLDQLQNASEKIKTANIFLEKSYGKEMERLIKVTGGFAPQKVLYARLHLLQGILRFHKGLFKDAISYLKQAEDEICQFRIEPNDPNFLELLNIGYDEVSARKGLRAANRDLDGAIQFLSDEQEKKKEIDSKERERELKRQREMKYGATSKGKRVNLRLVQYYVEELGFKESLVVEALKQVDNNEEEAADLLTNPSRLEVLKTSLLLKKEERRKKRMANEKRKRDAELIENCRKMIELGFNEALSLSALHQSNGNLEQAIIFLTENAESLTLGDFTLSQLEEQYQSQPQISPEKNTDDFFGEAEDLNNTFGDQQQDEQIDLPNNNNENEIQEQNDPKAIEERKRKKEEEQLAYELEDELKDAVQIHEGDYLNLTLEEEHQVFVKYKSLLESRNEWY